VAILGRWKGTSTGGRRGEEDEVRVDAFWRLVRSTFPWYIPPRHFLGISFSVFF
jgi:hypothetical protein